MASKHREIYLTHNANKEKLRLPIIPEALSVAHGGANTTVRVQELGDLTIKQPTLPQVITWNGFFPSHKCQGYRGKKLRNPALLTRTLIHWMDGEKPVRLIITGSRVNYACTIENFVWSLDETDKQTVYYTITLKRFQFTAIRRAEVKNGKIILPPLAGAREDTRAKPKTYVFKKGDTLFTIAKKLLGDGKKQSEIMRVNGIKNPAMIQPGKVLKIP